jgi:hypothetical protein
MGFILHSPRLWLLTGLWFRAILVFSVGSQGGCHRPGRTHRRTKKETATMSENEVDWWRESARALAPIINESRDELEKRRESLRDHLRCGGDITNVAVGTGMASAWLTAAMLRAEPETIARLIQIRGCFKLDFARLAIVSLHRGVMTDDLACPNEALAEMNEPDRLAELLHCLVIEAGLLAEKIPHEAFPDAPPNSVAP